MRLERLDLSRFGPFTGRTLDFGAGDSAASLDLHVVYGPNEAGKSTLQAAWVDLLFGMHRQSPHAHLHGYADLELGGRWHTGERALELRRFKNALRDEQGVAVDQAALGLEGLDRETYADRFSFGRAALEAAAEAMLENKGELGAALFSAGAGIPDLQRRLDEAMAEANAFYEPGKNKGKGLTALDDALNDVESRLREIDVNAQAWRDMKERARRAAEHRMAADAEVAGCRADLQRRQRELNALGSAAKYRRTLADLDALGAPDVVIDRPANALARVRELQEATARLDAQIDASSDRTLTAQLEALPPTPDALVAADELDQMRDLANQARQQRARRETLTATLVERDAQLSAARARLDTPTSLEVDRLTSGAARLNALQALLREHAGLETSLRNDRERMDALERERASLDDHDDGPVDITVLQIALEHARDNAGSDALRLLESQRDERARSLDDQLAALLPWTGDVTSLRTLAMPGETGRTERRAALGVALEQVASCELRLAELERSYDGSSRERDTRQDDEEPLDDAHARTLRERRDQLWLSHREALYRDDVPRATLRSSAHDFADALAEHDALAERRLQNADRVASLRQLDADLARHSSDIDACRRDLAQVRAIESEARRALTREAVALGLPADTPADDVDAWLRERQRALEAAAALRESEGNIAAAHDARAALASGLRQALHALPSAPQSLPDENAPLEFWIGTVNTRLATLAGEAETVRMTRRERDRMTAEIDALTVTLENTRDALADWQQRLTATLDGHWLSDADPIRLADALEPLRDLDQVLAARAAEREELAQLDRDQATFTRSIAELGKLVDITLEGDVESDATALIGQLRTLSDRQVERTRLTRERDSARHKRETLERERAPLLRELDVVRDRCNAVDVASLLSTLERIVTRDRLRDETETAERDLLDALGDDDLDECLKRLDSLQRDALMAEIAALEQQTDTLSETAVDRRTDEREAVAALAAVSGSEDVALLQARRANLLLEIRERAADTLGARLGREAVQEAVRRYRESHRGPLIARARQAFAELTVGRFTDLRTQPDAKGVDRLRAVLHDGRQRSVNELSDGTRFQLYLALRMATYLDHASRRAPPPFIVDDVMESFDEPRSRATLEQLAGMAAVGQVVYLTHHRHVVELAREATADRVHVHDLPQPT